MKLTIDVLGYMDGFYQVKITRPFGYVTRKEFTLDGLKRHITAARTHCENKKYQFELKGIDLDGI